MGKLVVSSTEILRVELATRESEVDCILPQEWLSLLRVSYNKAFHSLGGGPGILYGNDAIMKLNLKPSVLHY